MERRHRQQSAILLIRLARPSQILQKPGQLEARFHRLRLQGDGGGVEAGGAVRPVQRGLDPRQIDVEIGDVGRDGDGAADPVHRLVRPPGQCRQDAPQVKRMEMAGRCREDAAIQGVGLGEAPGLLMFQRRDQGFLQCCHRPL